MVHHDVDPRVAPLWLVAHDFSGEAEAATAEAAAELAARDGTLVLLHVYPTVTPTALPADVPVFAGAPFLPVDMEGLAHADVEEKLLRIRQRLEAAHPGLFIETLAREGRAADVILDVAAELDVDRIVVGTHGRHGLARALQGSVAERVARGAAVPVLVVKGPREHALANGEHG